MHIEAQFCTHTASKAETRLGFKCSLSYFFTKVISFTYINFIDGIAWEWKDKKQLQKILEGLVMHAG